MPCSKVRNPKKRLRNRRKAMVEETGWVCRKFRIGYPSRKSRRVCVEDTERREAFSVVGKLNFLASRRILMPALVSPRKHTNHDASASRNAIRPGDFIQFSFIFFSFEVFHLSSRHSPLFLVTVYIHLWEGQTRNKAFLTFPRRRRKREGERLNWIFLAI